MRDWLTSGGSSSPLLDLAYTYGGGGAFNNGNPTQIAITTAQTPGGTATNFTQSYAYDPFNRLCLAAEGVSVANCAASVSGSSWAQQFSYDQYGNMSGISTGLSSVPLLPAAGSYNLANQLTTGGATYDYAGNQLTRGPSALSYDAENRQTQDHDTVTGGYTCYTYDGMGERVTKTVLGSGACPATSGGVVTVYVHDAFGNVAAEYATGGAVPMACTTCYLSWDHLGSTRMVTDQSANVVPYGRHDYLPFGYEIPAGTDGRALGYWPGTGTESDYLTAKYTGAERDTETGFDFLQARYHASVQGRFMSPDPESAGASLGAPQSWNGYSYVGNNPMAYVDPSGLTTCDPSGNNCYDSITVNGDGSVSLPLSSFPPGSCVNVILDGVPQSNSCDSSAPAFTVNVTTPPLGPVSMPPGSPSNAGHIAGCFAKGLVAGAATAMAVGVIAVVAAPVVGATAVTIGLGALALAGTAALGETSAVDIQNHNWGGVAYNAGTVVGGLTAGFAGGARTATAIDPNASPGWSRASWKAQAYDRSKGSPLDWFGTGPTHAAAGLANSGGGFLSSLLGAGCR